MLVLNGDRFGAQAHTFSELRFEHLPFTTLERWVARMVSGVEARVLAMRSSPARDRQQSGRGSGRAPGPAGPPGSSPGVSPGG
jgi:hypothetical protein